MSKIIRISNFMQSQLDSLCEINEFAAQCNNYATDSGIYLRELKKAYSDKNIMLIMDQAAWHKSNSLNKFENIYIKFLPPYSPELNPIEKLWWWLRKERIHNNIFKTIDS